MVFVYTGLYLASAAIIDQTQFPSLTYYLCIFHFRGGWEVKQYPKWIAKSIVELSTNIIMSVHTASYSVIMMAFQPCQNKTMEVSMSMKAFVDRRKVWNTILWNHSLIRPSRKKYSEYLSTTHIFFVFVLWGREPRNVLCQVYTEGLSF